MSYVKRWSKTTKTIEEGWSACFKKNSYTTIDLAMSVASRRSAESDTKLYVYPCQICNEFHITSKKYKNSIEVEQDVWLNTTGKEMKCLLHKQTLSRY